MSLFAECPPPPSHYHHITADWKSIAKSPVCNDTPVTHVSSSQAPLDIDSRQAVKLLKVALTGVCSIVVEALNSSHQKDDSVLQHVMESFEKIQGKDSPEIRGLSELLNRFRNKNGLYGDAKFRNSNGVYMKIMNLRRKKSLMKLIMKRNSLMRKLMLLLRKQKDGLISKE